VKDLLSVDVVERAGDLLGDLTAARSGSGRLRPASSSIRSTVCRACSMAM